MNVTLQALVRDQRFDCQLALVRQHWASVRHLWLSDPEPHAADHARFLQAPDIGKFQSQLPPNFWIDCGMPEIASIKPTRDGRFEFAEDGLTAVIIPTYDTIPGLVGAHAERHVDELRDLVAVDVDRPDRFWRRRGEALVLGNAYLEIAGETRAPVPVFKNPMTWLRAAGAGVVVLDWAWARGLLLGRELIAEDVALGERLETTLRPEIWIMETAA